jgi:hypothetical protein
MKYGFGTFAVRNAFAAVFRVLLPSQYCSGRKSPRMLTGRRSLYAPGVRDLDAEIGQQFPLDRDAPALLARMLALAVLGGQGAAEDRVDAERVADRSGPSDVPLARTGNGSKLALPVAGVAHLNVRPQIVGDASRSS